MKTQLEKFSEIIGIKKIPSEYEESLFLKTQKYCKYISWIPWLKMVAVCNSLSMYATKESKETLRNKWTNGSDIDLFIITSSKRLWIVRIIITIIFQLLWVRRHGKKVKDRFCLSFFITEDTMDLSKIAIENDIYLSYWITFLKPILNYDKTYERFITNNKALLDSGYFIQKDNLAYIKEYHKPKILNFIFENRFSSNILDAKNYILRKLFEPKTLRHKKKLWSPFWIVVNEDMLKFTDNDKRYDIRDRILS